MKFKKVIGIEYENWVAIIRASVIGKFLVNFCLLID